MATDFFGSKNCRISPGFKHGFRAKGRRGWWKADTKYFPAGLHVTPRAWGDDGDGGTLLLTTHSMARFQAAEGGSMRMGRLEWLFGGDTWRAVRKEDHTQWLWDGLTGREICLGTDIPGRLYCATDGQGRFLARVDRPGLIWDLASLQTTSLHYPTTPFNMAGETRKRDAGSPTAKEAFTTPATTGTCSWRPPWRQVPGRSCMFAASICSGAERFPITIPIQGGSSKGVRFLSTKAGSRFPVEPGWRKVVRRPGGALYRNGLRLHSRQAGSTTVATRGETPVLAERHSGRVFGGSIPRP